MMVEMRIHQKGDPNLGIPPFVLSLGNPYVFFYFVLVVVILVYYGCVRLVNSPFGHVLQAIRDNEERAEFIGYDVRIFKRRSFVISGIIGGLSGSLFALLRFVDPDVLHWFISAEALVMNLFGGMGTLYGPIIGAFVFLFSKDLISSYTEHWRLILGVIFVGFVIYSPRGIVGLYETFRGKVISAVMLTFRRPGGGETRKATPDLVRDTNPVVEREPSPKLKGDLPIHGKEVGTEDNE